MTNKLYFLLNKMRDQSMHWKRLKEYLFIMIISCCFFFLSLSRCCCCCCRCCCDAHNDDLIKKHRMWHHVIININDYYIAANWFTLNQQASTGLRPRNVHTAHSEIHIIRRVLALAHKIHSMHLSSENQHQINSTTNTTQINSNHHIITFYEIYVIFLCSTVKYQYRNWYQLSVLRALFHAISLCMCTHQTYNQ